MHALKLYGRITRRPNLYGAIQGPYGPPWVEVRFLFKTAREQPVRGPGVWCDWGITCIISILEKWYKIKNANTVLCEGLLFNPRTHKEVEILNLYNLFRPYCILWLFPENSRDEWRGPTMYRVWPICPWTLQEIPRWCHQSGTMCEWLNILSCPVFVNTGKIAAILQTAFSSAFSWMKMFELELEFHWSLFLRVQSSIFQHWCR